jgi:hypothetical protein
MDEYADGEDGVEFRVLFTEHSSGTSEPLELVIRDVAEWRDRWAQIVSNRHPPPDPPDVDFDRDMVVLVGIGERGTGGYTVEIVDVGSVDGALRVVFRERIPGDSCVVTRALTSPITGVTVPRMDGSASFEHRTEIYECS